jgi:ferrous iron transport protein B
MARRGALSPAQILVSMVTITLFIPCIANFFMIVKERGWKTGLAIAGFIIPFAIGVGAALNFALRLAPGLVR